jgi:3-dehydroquinate synthase
MLQTLPRREWIAGLAEVIKYGIIADDELFSFLEHSMPELLKMDSQTVMRAVARSCEIKAEIVAADERESDRRRILNCGHTIGHALESLGGYRRLIHGEAVGIGLAAEAELAAHLGLCGTEVAERIRRLVQAAGLPDCVPPKTSFNALWGAMQHDKKVVGGNVIGVWPVRIGDVVIRPLPQEACAAWFRTLGSHERRRPERRKS